MNRPIGRERVFQMADYRVTGDEVKEIIETDLTAEQMAPFIEAAYAMIEDNLTGQGYSAATLKVIERWLAAHFVAIRDPGTRSETTGKASAVFKVGYLGRGLEHTAYGQQVMAYESKGILASLGQKSATIETLEAVDFTGSYAEK